MARSSELVHSLSEALGVPPQTIIVHDRNLAMAKLRPVGARGMNAPHVGARDAAMLITAILGSEHVKDSAASVQRYMNTMPDPRQGAINRYGLTGVEELASLPPSHSFVEALTAIIASAVEGSLASVLRQPGAGPQHLPVIEIGALAPGTLGQIRMAGLGSHKGASVNYVAADLWRDSQATLQEDYPGKSRLGDLELYHRISVHTISKVAELLASKGVTS